MHRESLTQQYLNQILKSSTLSFWFPELTAALEKPTQYTVLAAEVC